ncbi:MAG TPA: universal stress protein [Paracoccaceae bacterium]|nr:universal stress protein [Paracoccaceae bacterium]
MRKWLVIVDDTPECMNAMRYAARRAQKTGGGIVLLYVILPDELQHWAGVAELMHQEARDNAEERLGELATELQTLSGVMPEFVIREGKPAEEALTLIREEPEIGVLVLGGAEGETPGPLVTQLVVKGGGKMPIPVTVVPGGMSLERIDAVS